MFSLILLFLCFFINKQKILHLVLFPSEQKYIELLDTYVSSNFISKSTWLNFSSTISFKLLLRLSHYLKTSIVFRMRLLYDTNDGEKLKRKSKTLMKISDENLIPSNTCSFNVVFSAVSLAISILLSS